MALNRKVLCGLINIQSVGNKTIKINNLISELNLDILIITETWLCNNISDSSKIKEMTPKLHNFYHIPRENKWGGGVGIFIKKSFTNVQKMNNINFNSFEYIDTKITSFNKNIRIITIYRPPNKSKSEFIEELSDLFESLEDTRNLIICGDFNLHMDNQNDRYVKKFIDILENHDLVNNVKSSTSIGNHIIDLIIHNKRSEITSNIEIEPECTISLTHKLITFQIDTKKTEIVKKRIIYRNKNNFDAKNFIDECTNEISSINMNCECEKRRNYQEQICVSCYTENSKDIMSSKYNEKCPEIEKIVTVRERAKWYNIELSEARKQKRKMEDKWKRNKSTENWNNYKRARNRYNMLVEKNKKKYYNETFQNRSNSKEVHKNLENLLGLKNEKILPENQKDNKSLADEFVNFFDNKVDKICMEIAREPLTVCPSMPNIEYRKLKKFKKLSMSDFDKIFQKIKITYCENDPYPISDIHDAENFSDIKNLYMRITNNSLDYPEFPKCEKLACIKPGYKGKGDRNSLNSYRPISNLSFLSKIIEYAAYEQSWIHLNSQNIIPEEQSAYRENHSTETTNCAIMNDMIDISINGDCGILIMLDLSAAFDTVDHDYLLEDLKTVGFDEDTLEWYESYIKNREVTVIIGKSRSMTKKLTKGVPQGSVLGPMLFSVYTRELAWILKQHNIKYKLYADDTQFYIPIKSIQEAERKIESIMKDIRSWMVKKKLKLNENKTECMLFGNKNSLKRFDQINQIKIGTTTVEIVKKVKDLGVCINKELKMEDQINYTVKTCNYHLRNIAFIRKYLNVNTLKTLISNHILSRLDYCNALYYAIPKTLQRKLQRVQNSAARLITRVRQRERITPALIELHWLPIKARIEFKILTLTYKALKFNEPKYIRNMLEVFEQRTNVTTRQANEENRLYEPRTNCNYGERAYSYCAPRLYNKLPLEIRNSPNIVHFKRNLKTHLFEQCYDMNDKTIKEAYKL